MKPARRSVTGDRDQGRGAALSEHATKHFELTGHPIIEGYDPPEGWGWCYRDEVFIDLDGPTPQFGPIPRFVPGRSETNATRSQAQRAPSNASLGLTGYFHLIDSRFQGPYYRRKWA